MRRTKKKKTTRRQTRRPEEEEDDEQEGQKKKKTTNKKARRRRAEFRSKIRKKGEKEGVSRKEKTLLYQEIYTKKMNLARRCC